MNNVLFLTSTYSLADLFFISHSILIFNPPCHLIPGQIIDHMVAMMLKKKRER